MRKLVTGLAVAGLLFAGSVATAGTASAAQPGQRCADWSTSEPLLRPGATGDAVRAMQCQLNYGLNPDLGYHLIADGVFGQATLNAVYRFQQCMGLQADGVVGPQTWSKLDYWTSAANYPNC